MAKKATTAADLDTVTIIERLTDEKDRLFKLRVQNATGTFTVPIWSYRTWIQSILDQ
jgi:ribosomal protein L29